MGDDTTFWVFDSNTVLTIIFGFGFIWLALFRLVSNWREAHNAKIAQKIHQECLFYLKSKTSYFAKFMRTFVFAFFYLFALGFWTILIFTTGWAFIALIQILFLVLFVKTCTRCLSMINIIIKGEELQDNQEDSPNPNN